MNFFQNFRLKKSKRYRSAFTTEQINYLEQEFKKFPYIGNTNRKEVANILEISERAVKIWFQNRRMKEKREATGNKEVHVEDKNNINNTVSKELLSRRNMQSNNLVGVNEALLSNRITKTDKSKVSTIKNPKDHFTLNDKSVLTNQIKVKYFKNNKISNNKHSKIMDLTKDKSNLNILKSILPAKIKSETANILTEPLKNVHRNIYYNDVCKDLKNEKRNEIPCFNKKQTEVAQDLTMSNEDKKDHHYLVNSNIDQRFMPLYTQGYYAPPQLAASSTINSGNIIWKPVNVMPMPIPGLAACSPFSITHNCSGLSSNNQNVSKGNCNCHGSPHWFNARSQCVVSSQPQYVLAFPFSNSSHKI
uniref:Hox cluster protein ShxB n=1 Tax=Polygonia c-album TaxID=929971 RepID=A0A060D6L1_POLCL|nr:Hox cluster protein ShxB [Nymphalis c-album]